MQKTFINSLIAINIVLLITISITSMKPFGSLPQNERLSRIKNSANYKNGEFVNLSNTPSLAEDQNFFTVFYDFFFKKRNTEPGHVIETKKVELNKLPKDSNAIIWLGHSSYLLQIKNKRILVDPLIIGNASPFDFFGKPYKFSNQYTIEDFNNIDHILITHDHYDHLDHKTISYFKDSVKSIITSLGVGSHLEHWGVAPDKIVELDWWENTLIEDINLNITAAPARHFSGRLFKRNQTLWSSFVFEFDSTKYYIGGDSGYDSHFKKIGEKFGSFDFAILECGQYNKNWPYIHMMPEEVVQASKDLNARVTLPVHWSKFSLSLHEWDEPIKRFSREAEKMNITYISPMIGEIQVIK
jgi:L-ascorbate metabolism protein UlaG (beta-lactamase superfamily)